VVFFVWSKEGFVSRNGLNHFIKERRGGNVVTLFLFQSLDCVKGVAVQAKLFTTKFI
jgi:hypothetical protein